MGRANFLKLIYSCFNDRDNLLEVTYKECTPTVRTRFEKKLGLFER